MRLDRFAAASALGAALILGAMGIALTPAAARWGGVVELFHQAAGALVAGHGGQTTYLSLYPPLSLFVLTPPRLIAADLGTFAFLLAVEMSAIAAAGLLLVGTVNGWQATGRTAAPALTYAAFILLSAFVLPSTFDILPAVLTLAALAAATRQRGFVAGGLVGLAAALKLYAVVLLPALLCWHWFARQRGQALAAVCGFAIAGLVGISLYLLLPPGSPADLANSLANRGLQVESAGGSFLSIAAILGLVARPNVVNAGSFDFSGAAANGVLQVLSIVGPLAILGALVATGWRLSRRVREGQPPSPPELILACSAALLALLVTSKVFSPQYMLWLVPVLPFLPGLKRLGLLAAMALTAVIYPLVYEGVLQLQPIPTSLLFARNLLLIATLFGVVADLVAGRRANPGGDGLDQGTRFSPEVSR